MTRNLKVRADLSRNNEVEYARWWQRRCPAVAYFQHDNYPRCDLRVGHTGFHAADRGMFDAEWTEAIP